MPRDHDIRCTGLVEPVDEFAMQAECSDGSHGRRQALLGRLPAAGMIDTQMFPVRTQRNATFQGLYTYLDLFDGTWRDREGYGDDQFFKADMNSFDSTGPLVEHRFEKKNPDDADFSRFQSFLDGIALTGTAQPQLPAGQRQHPADDQLRDGDCRSSTTSTRRRRTSTWIRMPSPVGGRHPVGPRPHAGQPLLLRQQPLVTPADPGDRISELMAAILAVPEWRAMYFRRLRTVARKRHPRHGADGGSVRRASRHLPSQRSRWTSPPGPTSPHRRHMPTSERRCSTRSRAAAPSSPMMRGCRATSRPRRTS